MANIFSIISMVAFALSGLFLLVAVVLFFAMDTRSAYLELKGQPQKKQLVKESKRKESNKKEKTQNLQKSVKVKKAGKVDMEDEAITTLDNGEEATEVSLMSVYEPGTELFTENTTETFTEVRTNQTLRQEFWDEECETSLESLVSKDEFRITKRIVIVHSDEILK